MGIWGAALVRVEVRPVACPGLPANLQSLSSRVKSDWELLIILSNGVMFTPMHGYRDLLNEQEMRDVLSYIRTEVPFKAVG